MSLSNSIIDVKRLWLLLAFAICFGGTCLSIGSYFFISVSAEKSLHTNLDQAIGRVTESLTYGNYRSFVESLASDPEILKIEVSRNQLQLSSFHRERFSLFQTCITRNESNGFFSVTICRNENSIYFFIITIFIISLVLLVLGYYYLLKIESNTTMRIQKTLEPFGLNFDLTQKISFDFLINELIRAQEVFRSSRETELKLASLHSKNAISEQVSHDIRSPLSALEMISSHLGELPEEKRIIIRNSISRIRDIANSLILKNQTESKTISINHQKIDPTVQVELLMPIIDSLATEKRIQYRDMVHVDINFSQTNDSYGLFSKIDVNEFKRVISNLVNNAVEALPQKTGTVSITIQSDHQYNFVTIEDSGAGIPDEIIHRIGNRGATFNKTGGSGLGLHHAITTIESWGGSLTLDSKVGIGTTIRIKLPKVEAPRWFVPSLKLSASTTIVVFDDDQTIHQIWKGRLESLFASKIPLISFSSPNDLRIYHHTHFNILGNAIYLMDYEILNHKETGLDLIEELGIQKQSILVTSRYEEKQVRERCENLGVRLIPKSMSGFIPITTQSH